jgi:hypothetical protein
MFFPEAQLDQEMEAARGVEEAWTACKKLASKGTANMLKCILKYIESRDSEMAYTGEYHADFGDWNSFIRLVSQLPMP